MMKDLFVKALLCGCIFVGGSCVMANTLSSVEVANNGNQGKIVLNTDKTKIKKNIISSDEIVLNLKNTTVSENVKTICDNLPAMTEISVMQNGKNAYINLSGKDVANFELTYAKDGSIIPLSNQKRDFGFGSFAIFALVISAGIARMMNNFSRKSQESLRNTQLEQAVRKQMAAKRELKTLRARTKVSGNSAIHGAPVVNFAIASKMSRVTMPSSFRNPDEYMDYNQLKKAVNA